MYGLFYQKLGHHANLHSLFTLHGLYPTWLLNNVSTIAWICNDYNLNFVMKNNLCLFFFFLICLVPYQPNVADCSQTPFSVLFLKGQFQVSRYKYAVKKRRLVIALPREVVGCIIACNSSLLSAGWWDWTVRLSTSLLSSSTDNKDPGKCVQHVFEL